MEVAVVPSVAVHGPSRSLSFVLPFWNEVEGAERTIAVVSEAATELIQTAVVSKVEILAVNDGSTDATAQVLDSLAEQNTYLRVVHHAANQGLGGALRTGFQQASSDWIFYTDSDLPVDPLVCKRAFRATELHDADIVSCYRLDRTGEGVRREVLSTAYNSAVRAVTGLNVRDVNFAAKLLRRESVTSCLPMSNSLFFDAELLARALRSGATLQQIGVDYFPRSVGTSTLSSMQSIRDTARDLARIGPSVSIRK
ncbi:MAG: glycosyltransferase [Actinobacteria bacterium]|nr:glycosyltransferase [Actinomycetota bacterium]